VREKEKKPKKNQKVHLENKRKQTSKSLCRSKKGDRKPGGPVTCTFVKKELEGERLGVDQIKRWGIVTG